MARPAVYLRVSSEMQRDRESIKSQEDALNIWLASQGLTAEDVRWYRDDGISGKTPIMERGDGARLVADVRGGLISAFVAVFSISRISRETSDFFAFRSILRDNGIALLGVSEGIDTRIEGGDFVAGIHALLADEAQRALRKASMAGLHRRAREGKWIARAPYGYRINDEGTLEPLEPFAGIVRDIYRRYLNHRGAKQIADHLNARGVPSPAGRKWAGNTILRILHNPAYKGEGLWNVAEMKIGRRTGRKRPPAEHITIPCPPLVPAQEWDRAQTLLAHAAKHFQSTGTAAQGCLLSRIRCLKCGRRYYRIKANSRGGNYHYRHDTYGGKTCTSQSVPAAVVDARVWERVARALDNPALWLQERTAQRNSTARREELARRVEELTRALERNAAAFANLEDMALYGGMTIERYAVRQKELADAQSQLEHDLADARNTLESDHARAVQEQSLADEMAAFRAVLDNPTTEQQRDAIDHLIAVVRLSRMGGHIEIEIEWR